MRTYLKRVRWPVLICGIVLVLGVVAILVIQSLNASQYNGKVGVRWQLSTNSSPAYVAYSVTITNGSNRAILFQTNGREPAFMKQSLLGGVWADEPQERVGTGIYILGTGESLKTTVTFAAKGRHRMGLETKPLSTATVAMLDLQTSRNIEWLSSATEWCLSFSDGLEKEVWTQENSTGQP